MQEAGEGPRSGARDETYGGPVARKDRLLVGGRDEEGAPRSIGGWKSAEAREGAEGATYAVHGIL